MYIYILYHMCVCIYILYHIYIHIEKFKVATLLSLSVAAVAVRAFCTVGQKLQAQGLLIQDVDSNIHHLLNCTRIVCWTMLSFNTAPQYVGASNTLHKTNIVETQSYYVDTMV